MHNIDLAAKYHPTELKILIFTQIKLHYGICTKHLLHTTEVITTEGVAASFPLNTLNQIYIVKSRTTKSVMGMYIWVCSTGNFVLDTTLLLQTKFFYL